MWDLKKKKSNEQTKQNKTRLIRNRKPKGGYQNGRVRRWVKGNIVTNTIIGLHGWQITVRITGVITL